MRLTRFVAFVVGLAACGLVGPARADAIISPVNKAINPTFDIHSAEVRRDGDFLNFRMTLRSNAGTSLPPRTGKYVGSQAYAYIWPTSADTSVAGFPSGQGVLALALVSHPDLVETVGGIQYAADWHPHWMVLVPAKGCGPYGLRIMAGNPVAPGAPAPLMNIMANLPSAMSGATLDIRVPVAMLGDPALLRFDGMTASLVVSGSGASQVVCVRPIDVASGRLVLQGTVTQVGSPVQ